jgi:outer membrane lipopolysaccharide assembly protein LptE/RlpB
LEDALETAEEDDIIAALETSIGKGTLEITKAMDDYLQRPFSSKGQSFAATYEERAALRELRKFVTEELLVPSDLGKEWLGEAIESLC